jgi:hypothetical protein
MTLIRTPAAVIKASRLSGISERLKFPSDLGAHAMIINFEKYSYSTAQTGAVNSVNSGTIVLPIPTNLVDSTSISANDSQLGITGAAAMALMNASGMSAKQAGADTYSAILSQLKKLMEPSPSGSDREPSATNDALSTFRAFTKFTGRNLLDAALPGAGMAADLTSGTAVNPHQTLEFNGVALKNHSFVWTFSPRNEDESIVLKRIIKKIKTSMLPAYDSIGGFQKALLTYPDLIKIGLVGVDQDFFYYYKPSLVKGLTINYNEGDSLSLFSGGKPVQITMTMEIMEAQIHTKSDYEDSVI